MYVGKFLALEAGRAQKAQRDLGLAMYIFRAQLGRDAAIGVDRMRATANSLRRLQEGDAQSALGQLACGSEAREPRADDDDIGMLLGHAGR